QSFFDSPARGTWKWEPYVLKYEGRRPFKPYLGFAYRETKRRVWNNVPWNPLPVGTLVTFRQLAFPHWLIVLALATMAVLARPKPRLRFSLGELAILVTAFTVLLTFAT